jgi:hypothetical protein
MPVFVRNARFLGHDRPFNAFFTQEIEKKSFDDSGFSVSRLVACCRFGDKSWQTCHILMQQHAALLKQPAPMHGNPLTPFKGS